MEEEDSRPRFMDNSGKMSEKSCKLESLPCTNVRKDAKSVHFYNKLVINEFCMGWLSNCGYHIMKMNQWLQEN